MGFGKITCAFGCSLMPLLVVCTVFVVLRFLLQLQLTDERVKSEVFEIDILSPAVLPSQSTRMKNFPSSRTRKIHKRKEHLFWGPYYQMLCTCVYLACWSKVAIACNICIYGKYSMQ